MLTKTGTAPKPRRGLELRSPMNLRPHAGAKHKACWPRIKTPHSAPARRLQAPAMARIDRRVAMAPSSVGGIPREGQGPVRPARRPVVVHGCVGGGGPGRWLTPSKAIGHRRARKVFDVVHQFIGGGRSFRLITVGDGPDDVNVVPRGDREIAGLSMVKIVKAS
jgi:hypothetical protein